MHRDRETALKQSSAKHLLNISLLRLSYLHTARARTAAHIQMGYWGNARKYVEKGTAVAFFKCAISNVIFCFIHMG